MGGIMLAVTFLAGAQDTLTVNGGQKYQTIDGYGVNCHTESWNGGEVRPALDLLVDQLGATLFRAVIEEMDWEAANDDADPNNFNWTYFNTVYSNARFQEVWNTLRYLNQKGIVENGLIISFMGKPPDWMGGNATVSSANEDEFVESIASLLYYARNTAGIRFTLVSPMNEADTGGVEGPDMGATQFARILRKLAVKLDAIGLSDIRFSSPDAAGNFQAYFNEIVKDPVIMAKVAHWGVHCYFPGTGGAQSIISGSAYPNKSFWVTETATFLTMLGQIDENPTANLVWDGFDAVYLHAIRAGRGSTPPNDSPGIEPPLVAYNTTTRLYTPRKGFYEHAQLFKFVAPGAQRIGASANDPNLILYAFNHPSGRLTIVGRNNNGGSVTINGSLLNLPAVSTLELYQTTSTVNLQRGADVTVTGGAFSVQVLGNGFFTLTGTTGAPTNQPPSVSITSPTGGATFAEPATITINATASDPDGTVTRVEFFQGATRLGEDALSPYSFTWSIVTAGTYTLTARATDNLGATSTSAPVTITVTGTTPPPPSGATTIWSATAIPTNPSDPDTGSVELGVKFRSDVDGQVTGIRFYKGTGNTGTHIGNLWTAAGANLARVTFTSETATGWQEAAFATPVSITAGTTYVASYFAPAGRYAGDTNYFNGKGQDNPPLHALADGVDGPNGVYVYSSVTAFPTQSFQSTNYWVDIVFTAGSAPPPPPPPPGPPPPVSGSGGGSSHRRCGCSSIAVHPSPIGLGLVALLSLGLVLARRR